MPASLTTAGLSRTGSWCYLSPPAHQLGGDYYDFIPLGPERIAIAIADISGKGLPGALLMATLQSLVRTNFAAREGRLARFAQEVSERLYEQTASGRSHQRACPLASIPPGTR